MKEKPRQRGSILLMTVGLLTILAMLGGTLLIIANLDRKANHALADAAPITQEAVAKDTLVKLLADRAADLYINPVGTNGPYSAATTIAQTIDYPDDSSDRALASTTPYFDTSISPNRWRWRHVSNLPGNLAASPSPNWATTDSHLTDTDGDGIGDSLLYDSGFRDSQSRPYFVAVRMIDASALINVNTAYEGVAAVPNWPMPATNVHLYYLGLDPNAIHRERTILSGVGTPAHPNYDPNYENRYVIRPLNPFPRFAGRPFPSFDPGDMMAIRWLGSTPNNPPSTAGGRLYTAMGATAYNYFYSSYNTYLRSYFTTWSSSRIILPRPVTSGTTTQWWKVDLNNGTVDQLYSAFYNMIPLGVPGLSNDAAQKEKTCAQLAVNVVDFRDATTDTVFAVKKDATNHLVVADAADTDPNILAYGTKRQPFVTELFYKLAYDDPKDPNKLNEYSAIELFNPYTADISLTGYELRNVGPALTLPGSILAGKRMVIASHAGTVIPVDPGATSVVSATLDLGNPQGITIVRSRLGNGTGAKDVVIAKIPQVAITPPVDANSPPQTFVKQWDDNLGRARYTLPDVTVTFTNTRDYTTTSGGTATPASTNLGKANDGDFSGFNQPPCPVYVRNGRFINTAELDRIFYVGPSNGAGKDQDLRAALTNSGSPSNGRLPMAEGIVSDATNWPAATVPRVPLGVLASDYFMVESPLADGVDNDGDAGIPPDTNKLDPTNPNLVGREDSVYGRINPNTAPDQVLASLPGIAAMGADSLKLVREIIAYRDLLDNTTPDPNIPGSGSGSNYTGGRAAFIATTPALANLRTDPGFACPGEIAIPLWVRGQKPDLVNAGLGLPQNTYSPTNAAPYNYALEGTTTKYDDGLLTDATNKVLNDFAKYHTFYSWLSNQVTVRSDVFIAYIRVQLGNDAAAATGVQRYLAVIDRSNCRTANDVPTVLMFMQIK